jgi:ubiquinone/menaquinone biosynthesis C-methylase UbiE
MGFAVSAESYDRFMGRYSGRLAPLFADFAGVDDGGRVLDVGCGPGALTAELFRRHGADRVAAVDPAEQFVESCRARTPGADVRRAAVEQLPFADAGFDGALAQLVVAFMRDADAGAAEMRRVVRAGGTVAVCMWAAGEQMQLLSLFWRAASIFDGAGGEADRRMRYRTRDELAGLLERAGLADVETELLSVESRYESFEELWESLGSAAGPVNEFVTRLDEEQRSRLRDELTRLLGEPQGGFSLSAAAWAARGRG